MQSTGVDEASYSCSKACEKSNRPVYPGDTTGSSYSTKAGLQHECRDSKRYTREHGVSRGKLDELRRVIHRVLLLYWIIRASYSTTIFMGRQRVQERSYRGMGKGVRRDGAGAKLWVVSGSS